MKHSLLLIFSLVLLLSLSCSALQPRMPTPAPFPTHPSVLMPPATATDIPTDTAVPPTLTPFFPTLTFAPATVTPLPVTLVPPPAFPTLAPPFVIVTPTPDGRDLATVLAAEAQQAQALGLKPFAEFEAPW